MAYDTFFTGMPLYSVWVAIQQSVEFFPVSFITWMPVTAENWLSARLAMDLRRFDSFIGVIEVGLVGFECPCGVW